MRVLDLVQSAPVSPWWKSGRPSCGGATPPAAWPLLDNGRLKSRASSGRWCSVRALLPLWLAAATALSAGGEAQSDHALKAWLEVATQDEPYLVLDLAASRLRLMSGGAVLRNYPITAVEVGGSSVAFSRRTTKLPVRGGVWELKRLDPPRSVGRPVIIPPVAGRAAPPLAIPLEPEEALPAPASYRLQFHAGLSIEVAQDVPGHAEPWWTLFRRARWKLGDLGESISLHPEVRLRLVLPSAEAGALYRSLPIPVLLLVS